MIVGNYVLFVIVLFISSLSFSQDINECKEIIGFNKNEFIQCDCFSYDSLTDVKNGYFEITDSEDIIYCQLAQFNATDSVLLFGTGYYSDMQCSNYFSKVYSIKNDRGFSEISVYQLFPNLTFEHFLQGFDEVLKIIEKYLPEIKSNYLGEEGTIDDVINELFDFHFFLPHRGTAVEVTVTICDYIPTNAVSIKEEDWAIIENSPISREFKFDKNHFSFTEE